MVLDDLRSVFLCLLRVDGAGYGVCPDGDFAAPARLDGVLHDNQFYYLGVLFFAFTLLQAYFEFAQYFVIWNGNVPDETFFYLIREHGSWWWVSMILIFGHFFLPFILLLPAHVKMNFKIMLPVCAWAWLMNYRGPGVQHPARRRCIRTAIRSTGSGCNSAASRSWAGCWRDVPEKVQEPSAVSANAIRGCSRRWASPDPMNTRPQLPEVVQ